MDLSFLSGPSPWKHGSRNTNCGKSPPELNINLVEPLSGQTLNKHALQWSLKGTGRTRMNKPLAWLCSASNQMFTPWSMALKRPNPFGISCKPLLVSNLLISWLPTTSPWSPWWWLWTTPSMSSIRWPSNFVVWPPMDSWSQITYRCSHCSPLFHTCTENGHRNSSCQLLPKTWILSQWRKLFYLSICSWKMKWTAELDLKKFQGSPM